MISRLSTTLLLLASLAFCAHAPAAPDTPPNLPSAMVDLMTDDGVALLKGAWRYSDARLVAADFRSPGPDLKPSGPPNRTLDLQPRAGAADFDDSDWPIVAPSSLMDRRSTGKICAGWLRFAFTVPSNVAAFPVAGADVVFEIVADDYAEVWIDGQLPVVVGQSGGPLVRGYNAPNRVVVARDAKPGQRIQIAVCVLNGPFSDPPSNFVWVRSASLEFFAPGRLSPIRAIPVEVLRLDPAIDRVVPRDARLELCADGFVFTEGPVWRPGGDLLFSDPNRNTIYRWTPDGDTHVFRVKSGYSGMDIGEYSQPGSNGLALDPDGRLTICEHGNRRITRLEKNGVLTVLADRHDGKRLNSPNDLVYRSDGALFFTDPPFGLPRYHDDRRREQPHFGVYCLKDNALRLISTDLTGPNGLAFSPDEKFLYVANWDTARKVVMRYDCLPSGDLVNGRVFFDMTPAPGEEALDGLKVDSAGNLFVSGPGGVWVIAPSGAHLGTIRTPLLPANFAWGDADGRTLYMAARSSLYRMRMVNAGAATGR